MKQLLANLVITRVLMKTSMIMITIYFFNLYCSNTHSFIHQQHTPRNPETFKILQ